MIPVPLPINYKFHSTINQKLIVEYINQLNEQELIVYKIALEQLESSFDIFKSLGFIEWKKKK